MWSALLVLLALVLGAAGPAAAATGTPRPAPASSAASSVPPVTARPCADGSAADRATTHPASTRHGRIAGIVPPRPVPAHCRAGTTDGTDALDTATQYEAPYSSGATPPLVNHGGPVMGTVNTNDQVVITPIYWAPTGYAFDSAYQTVVNGYLSNLAADSGKTTNAFATLFQYSGSNGAINYRLSVHAPIADTNPYPTPACTADTSQIYSDNTGFTTCVDDAQERSEIAAVVAANGLPIDLGHIYVLMLPKHVESCQYADGTAGQACEVNSGATSAYCAYHSAFGTGTVYANVPYPVYGGANDYATCANYINPGTGYELEAPNGNLDADTVVSPLGHELAEAISDPYLNTWYDSSGNENGDECAYIFGALAGSSGTRYNQTVNGAHYLTQEEFSNKDFVPGVSGCLQSIQPVTPTVTAVSPTSGSPTGGLSVTITGTGFPGATGVKFGATAAGSFTINNSGRITATAPAGTGAVDVTVTTAAGTSATSSADVFTYTGPPAVTAVSPTTGATSGGQSVTVSGTGFTGATAVRFGTTAASSYTVNSATQVTATAPAGSAGTVDVTVTTAAGTSATGSADHFTYVAAPTVTAVSPTTGATSGGQSVTVSGTGFTGATAVRFGSTAASSYTVNSATQVTATAPAGSAGTVDVTVTTVYGTSATGSADHFAYVAAPAVSSVSPSTGPTAGGQSVTISGSGFSGATAVRFGSTAASSYTVNSATQVTATAPAGSAGTVDVTVTTAYGTSATGSADHFTYVAAPTVSSVSPTDGPAAGGASVTISGSGLSGATAVAFGGTAASSYTVNSATQITATAPAHAAGTVDVVVTTAGGASTSVGSDQYTFVAAPTVTAVSPASGPTGGGQSVTITGTGFTGATSVHFGATVAAAYTISGDTQITVTAPAHAAGLVDLTVVSDGGTSATATADRYTYVAPPTVTSVSPNAGPTAGGQTVTITGTNFTGGAMVAFGATSASAVTVNSATQITATSPAHAAGAVDVTVTTAGGTSATGSSDTYTYGALPAVTAVSPSSGSTAGATSVTITGANFAAGATVSFGGTTAAAVTVNSATQITATTPAHAAGTVDVTVTTSGGTSSTGSADGYTFVTPPAVTGVAPASGSTSGGLSVTITGTGFSGATAVTVGGTTASYTVDSATQITATTPAHVAGTVDVVVTNAGGTSATGAADRFTYVTPPVVTVVSPGSGSVTGGDTVVISGTGFTGATDVQFGPGGSTAFTIDSATQITATSPGGTAGPVDVAVTTAGGTSATSAADAYTFVPNPAVTAVAPLDGPTAGGQSVTISGSGFTGATSVLFGAEPAPAFTVDADGEITATSPAHAAGPVDVLVTTAVGTSPVAEGDSYVFVAPPAVTAVAPIVGSTLGGESVTITGTGLSGVRNVTFGSVAAPSVGVLNDTELLVTTPAHTAGTVEVTVSTDGGPSATTLSDRYTYVAVPTVSDVSPAAGPTAGGTTVTITGSGFTADVAVAFGATPAASVHVDSPAQIIATAPAHGAGAVDVTVSSVGGDSAAGADDSYTYVDAPEVTGVSPAVGPGTGGQTVTITGAGFGGANAVAFDGTDAAAFTVDGPTQITATTPVLAPGHVHVRVTTTGGTSAAGDADTYSVDPVPTVSDVTPAAGPSTGGDVVTITGSGFTPDATVSFGGTSATAVVVDSVGQIRATAPAHTPAAVAVAVTTPGGSSTAVGSDEYTFVAAPTVTGVAPGAGPVAGGETVTITGTGFSAATEVDVDGAPLSAYGIDSDTQISVTVPGHAAGAVDVTVVSEGGASAVTEADLFTYEEAPTVTSVAPAAVPTGGGSLLTVIGSHFTDGATVTVGGVAATGVTVVSAGEITARTPAHEAGTVDLVVTTPGGPSPTSNSDHVTYDPRPAVTGVSPRSGRISGGSVTIIGSGYVAGARVTVGGSSATSVVVVSPTKITAHVPSHAAGTVDLHVVTPGGTSATVATDRYTYLPRPTVTSLSSTRGTKAGGKTVTVIGTGFVSGATVSFGAVAGTHVSVVSPTKLTVITPKHAGGTVDVAVTTPGGKSATSTRTRYTFA